MSRILIIEDNAQSARLAVRILRRHDHEVIVAVDGEQGMTAALSLIPDLIMVDLGLPDIDGQTVVALLRQQPTMKGVPMIAFTAWPTDTAMTMARAYGCDGIITKPIDTRSFAEQVEAYLAQPTES